MTTGLRVLLIGGHADESLIRVRLSVGGQLERIERTLVFQLREQLREGDWNLLLVDPAMPGLEQFWVEARACEPRPAVLALVEPSTEEAELSALMAAGAAAFVTRPELRGLLPVAERLTGEWQQTQQSRGTEARLRRSTAALLQLAQSRKLEGLEVETALKEILEAASRGSDAALASVWRIDRSNETLRELQQFDARHSSFTGGGTRLHFSDFPIYFRALEEQQQVVADDALEDPRTRALGEKYLAGRGISSLLDTGVRIGGELKGILCLEHIGPPRQWSTEDQVFASALADLIALVFQGQDRQRAEARATDSEGRFRELFAHSRDVIVLYSVTKAGGLRCEDANPATLELVDMPLQKLIGRTPHEVLLEETADLLMAKHRQVMQSRKAISYEHWLDFPFGRVCFNTALIPFFDSQGAIFRIAAIARNVTQQRRMEAQLADSRKLEALGHLAGHIAHDFNNLLAGVTGWASRIRELEDPVVRESAEQILKASSRARELTRQVLTFGRPASTDRVPLELTELLRELVKLLEPTLDSETHLHVELQSDDTLVLGDAGQLHQAVLNLCTNALQAMDRGGLLFLKLDSVEVSDEFAQAHPPLVAGHSVRLRIQDNGHGMAPETLARMFEPFFTTKQQGIGSGLGLSVVRGIVQAHTGTLVVESTLGEGTSFELYLPALVAKHKLPPGVRVPSGTGEQLMLVDDQANVARSSAMVLNHLGYRTTVFTDPREALAAFASAPERFDVVMTDLTMPEMSGVQLATALHNIRPGVPVIVTTGREVSSEETAVLGLHQVLEKPWRAEDAIRVLDRVLRPASPT